MRKKGRFDLKPFDFLSLGDGLIQEKELQHVMRACMDENGMNFDEGEVDELTRALYHDATTLTKKMSAAGVGPQQPYHPASGITFEALKVTG